MARKWKPTPRMEQVEDAVIVKIQKLLELASRTKGNEEEAARAGEAAQRLLAKYNLDMAVVRETAVAGGTFVPESKRSSKRINRSAQYDWQKSLWLTLAQCNFCFHYVQKFEERRELKNGRVIYSRIMRHVLFGKEENVALVHAMGDYLCDAIERLLPFNENATRLSRQAISWRAGCAARLEHRLIEQRAERNKVADAQKDSGSCALALRDVESSEFIANYDSMFGKGAYAEMVAAKAKAKEDNRTNAQKFKDEQKAARQRHKEQCEFESKYDFDQFGRGFEEGGNINLNNQVEARNGDSQGKRLS